MKFTAVIYAQNAKEAELEATLKALKGSTLADYEVLALDDGSDRSYKELAEKYKARYVKTEKRGALASYLYALEIAKGEYITFIKSGEHATFNYYMPMLDMAYSKNADVVCGDIAYEYEGVKFTCNEDSGASFSCASKIYRVSALKKAKIELEKTKITMLSIDTKAEMTINAFALKNATNVQITHTGYAFLKLNDEKLDLLGLAREAGKALCELDVVCNADVERELDARTLCYLAKIQKEKALIAQIEIALGVSKIKPISKKEATQYRKIELLGDNFADIEKALKKIYDTSIDVMVIYDLGSTYEKNTLDYIQSRKKGIKGEKPLTLMVPKRITKKKVKLKPEQIMALARFH